MSEEECERFLSESTQDWEELQHLRAENQRLRECRDILEELVLPKTDAGMPLGLWCAIHRVLGKEVPERRPKYPKPERCQNCGCDDMDWFLATWECGKCGATVHCDGDEEK